eukprot:8907458-Pyramimonas_sp.AAC.1
MSGCMAPDLQEEAMNLNWDQHSHYIKVTHTPIRFIFRSFNNIVDDTSELIGVGAGPKGQENPTAFPGSLRILVESAIKLVGDVITRARDGAIEI